MTVAVAEPAAVPVADRAVAGTTAAAQWAQIRSEAPRIDATMQRYLQRLAAFQAASSVDVAENALRQFAGWMITDAGLDSIASVRRDDIEDFKVWLATSRTHVAARSRPRRPRSAARRREAVDKADQSRLRLLKCGAG